MLSCFKRKTCLPLVNRLGKRFEQILMVMEEMPGRGHILETWKGYVVDIGALSLPGSSSLQWLVHTSVRPGLCTSMLTSCEGPCWPQSFLLYRKGRGRSWLWFLHSLPVVCPTKLSAGKSPSQILFVFVFFFLWETWPMTERKEAAALEEGTVWFGKNTE